MLTKIDDIAYDINNSQIKLLFVAGFFDEFSAHNFANDYNYSYLDFNDFLKENKIDSNHFKEPDKERKTAINISIDNWIKKMAFKEQKETIIIDGFSPKKIPDFLTKSLLMQELLYLSKNSEKLKTNIVFFIDLNNGSLENQILAKILHNSKIITW